MFGPPTVVDEMNGNSKWRSLRGVAGLVGRLTGNTMLLATSMLKFTTDHASARLTWVLNRGPGAQGALQERGGSLRHPGHLVHLQAHGGSCHFTDSTNAAATSLFNPFELTWNGVFGKIFDIPMRSSRRSGTQRAISVRPIPRSSGPRSPYGRPWETRWRPSRTLLFQARRREDQPGFGCLREYQRGTQGPALAARAVPVDRLDHRREADLHARGIRGHRRNPHRLAGTGHRTLRFPGHAERIRCPMHGPRKE
jgi:hypothetical protein